MLPDIATAFGLLVLLFASEEIGYRFGCRRGHSSDADGTQIGSIQGTMLGLLGLLLGFSFANAGTRFLDRQDLVVTEANAIGTSFLRADLLDEPYRGELRTALRRYVAHRVALSHRLQSGWNDKLQAEVSALHAAIWKAASEGSSAKPDTIVSVIPAVNDVIDMHSSRLGAVRKHIPFQVILLLVACSCMSLGVIGYCCGAVRRRYLLLSTALAILIAATLWITIDLDTPRAGMLRASDQPLIELKQEIGA